MLTSRFLLASALFVSVFSAVACAAPASDEATSTGAEALTSESIGITCRTLGEVGQCGATSLCKTASEAQCKAKASSIASDPDWARTCNKLGSKQACDWNSNFCSWEQTSLCIPRSGKPSVAEPNLGAACGTLGELGACARVPACKSSIEGVCRATDDAIASDPQWQRMCPSAGTSQDACDAQAGFCQWENVNQCTPRAVATAPLDLGTACKTLGEVGACGTVSLCKGLGEPRCNAKASALASDPSWADACLRAGVNEQACGWQSSFCTWEAVDECVPLAGPRPGSVVDIARACDTFGQAGVCSRAPICKPVSAGSCRPTANALAADPDWAQQCPRAGSSPETCGFLSSFCKWELATSCVAR